MKRAWIAPLVAAAAAVAWRELAPPRNDDRSWMLIARDSSYSISLDTTRIARVYDRGYEVWYRTDHVATRYYREKAFDRETVKMLILCRDGRFKVISTTMSMRGERPVLRQLNSEKDVNSQPWHSVEAGSTDADAARATCVVADSRWRGR